MTRADSREAAAQPQRIEPIVRDLARIDGRELEVTDAAGERLTRLSEQIDRRGTEQQESTAGSVVAPSRVDETAQVLEEIRCALYLVEDDEFVGVLRKVGLGVGEFGPIGVGLEIQVHGGALVQEAARERGLADLARPQQYDRRHLSQCGVQRVLESSRNHRRNYGASFHNCNDKRA